MTRTYRLSATLAAALTAGFLGCAHCDTCDEFPTPCVAGQCDGSGEMYAAVPTTSGPIFDAPVATAPTSVMMDPMSGPGVPAAPIQSQATPPPPPIPAPTAPRSGAAPSDSPPAAVPASETPRT